MAREKQGLNTLKRRAEAPARLLRRSLAVLLHRQSRLVRARYPPLRELVLPARRIPSPPQPAPLLHALQSLAGAVQFHWHHDRDCSSRMSAANTPMITLND